MGQSFAAQGPSDQILLALSATVALLLVLAGFFAAATLLLRMRNFARERRRDRLEASWEAPILAALAGDSPPHEVHARVGADEQLLFVRYLVRWLKRVAGSERGVLRALARPMLPAVARQLASRQPEVRARAVQTLVLLGMEDYDDVVVAALDDPSTIVAMVAARTLAAPEHARFAPAILRRLPRFRDWSGSYLSSMLSGMGSAVLPALRALYVDETAAPADRRIAGDALWDLDDIESADTAARIVSSDGSPELRAASLRLLGRVGRPEHAAVARRALDSHDALLRLRAAEAMVLFAVSEDVPRLRILLDDPSTWVAIAAARALLEAGGGSVLRAVADSGTPRALIAREVLDLEPA